jgi:pyruvate dehydrogenase E2 component (dihydrolipoamide acetyltransferase)
MLHKITMPDAGQTTDQLVVARWLKKVGEAVARGDVLLEVETDKATVSVESFAQGKLLKRMAEAGETATAGDVIAWVGEEADLAAAAEAKPAAAAPPATPSPAVQAAAAGSAPRPAGKPGWVVASPAARKAARELGLDLAEIARSTGRPVVKRADVLAFRAPQRAAALPPPAPDRSPDPAAFELVRPSRTRQAIAARMVQSVTTIPAFTLEAEVDMSRCAALRKELNGRKGDVRIAYHDLVAKCVAAAAKRHPLVNASWREDGIRLYRSVNVGLAVARDEGLVVPVVKDVGGKGLEAVARENAQNVAAVRGGTVRPEALEGGTITLSNLGMFPVRRFTAIINPPQSCIVALGAIADRPAWIDGAWAARPTLCVTASFDHRVLDGAEGAAFLKDLQELLESPAMLLL